MSRIYVFSKRCLFKRDRKNLKFKDLIQRCLIRISAVRDSAKSASARFAANPAQFAANPAQFAANPAQFAANPAGVRTMLPLSSS
jgi:hypothetical protein